MQQSYTTPRILGYKHAGCFVGTKRCPSKVAARQRSCRASAATNVSLPATKVSTQSLEQLRVWLGSKGVAVDKVQVIPNIVDGSAMLVAEKDIASGDALISVPDSLWLSPAAIAKRSASGKLASEEEPWLQIALALMGERSSAGGNKSGDDWSTYLACAPAVLDSPLFWTEEQVAMLEGTQLLQSLLGYREFFSQTFEDLQQRLFSQNPAAFPASAFNLESFMWAAATVRGRLHAPLDAATMALVPLADSVAHRRVGNVAWKPRSGGLFARGQALVVEASRPIRKGEQLSMNFAANKPDNGVLLDYGVMDRMSPQAGYTLPLSLPEGERFIQDKIDILEEAGFQPSTPFTLSPSALPSSEMMAFLRLMHLKGIDGFLLEPLLRNEVWAYLLEPVSQANELALCQTMVEGAKVALDGFPTSIADDRALQQTGGVAKGSREETAVLIRLGEKESLDGALRFFEERGTAESINSLEYYQERRLKRLGLLDGKGKSTYDGFFDKGIA